MKITLIDSTSESSVYTYDEGMGSIDIESSVLKAILENSGITIPRGEKEDPDSDFYEKSVIYLNKDDHSLFHDAFLKFYYPGNYSSERYKWRVLS